MLKKLDLYLSGNCNTKKGNIFILSVFLVSISFCVGCVITAQRGVYVPKQYQIKKAPYNTNNHMIKKQEDPDCCILPVLKEV